MMGDFWTVCMAEQTDTDDNVRLLTKALDCRVYYFNPYQLTLNAY